MQNFATFRQYYTIKLNTARVAASVGNATKLPYFTNVPNPIGAFSFLRILSHIIPANAPTGVKYAPRFDATTAAYTAFVAALPTNAEEVVTALYSTDIGILLITLATKNPLVPTVQTGSPLDSNIANLSVSPLYCKASTNTNMLNTNGTNS